MFLALPARSFASQLGNGGNRIPMKVNLVVASGVHEGKIIPIPVSKFLIGRDPDCHLRPASPAISKKHCLIYVDSGKLLLKDLGSTNGTFLNTTPVTEPTELKHGDLIKVGPLDFRIEMIPGRKSDTLTPKSKSDPAGLASTASKTKETETDPAVVSSATPTPGPIPKTDLKSPATHRSSSNDDPEQIAAMLLGMDDDNPDGSPPHVPEGSTVHELPAIDVEKLAAEKKAENDRRKSTPPTAAETSQAASEILKKYLSSRKK